MLCLALLLSIAVNSVEMFFASIAIFAVLWVGGFFDEDPVRVGKLRFDKYYGIFELEVENQSNRPIWLNYSLSCSQSQPVEQPVCKEGGMEFLPASSLYAVKQVVLSEHSSASPLESKSSGIFMSKNLDSEGCWDSSCRELNLNLSYFCDKSGKVKTVSVKVPVESHGMHPFLRNVGSARELILRDVKGAPIARVSSLFELTPAAKVNLNSFESHLNRGDVQRWVASAVGDSILAERLDSARCSGLESVAKVIDERLLELLKSKHTGKHPFLNQVEAPHEFILKSDESNVIAVCNSLDSLLDSLDKSNFDSIRFHTSQGNDFSRWVTEVLGDMALAERINRVDYSHSGAGSRLSDLISCRIKELSS
jgi:hypothetical protein